MGALQDQLEQIVAVAQREPDRAPAVVDEVALRNLEERIGAMQSQIQSWLDARTRVQRSAQVHDNEAWAPLMSLVLY